MTFSRVAIGFIAFLFAGIAITNHFGVNPFFGLGLGLLMGINWCSLWLLRDFEK